MDRVYRGWAGKRKAQGGLKQPFGLKNGAVPSVWDPNWYNPQGEPRLMLGAAWYPMQSY